MAIRYGGRGPGHLSRWPKAAGTPTPTPETKVLAEGDSITATTTPNSYSRLYAAEHPTLDYHNEAVGGSTLGDLVTRRADALALNPTVLSVLIGANDLPSDVEGYRDDLYDYIAPFMAAGCTIILCTVLPRTAVSGWNARRASFNTLLRADEGVEFDYLVDFDTCEVGVDGAENDADLYPDGLHPSATGQAVLKRVYSTVVNHVLGIANEPLDFAFAPVLNADPDTDYESGAYTVRGLFPGETRPYSAVGYVSKNGGAYVLDGFGTAAEDDRFELRIHSSADDATETIASLTIGATLAEYSVTTSGGSDLWTPLDLGSKLATYLTPATLSGSTGDDLGSWADESGNSVAWTREAVASGFPKLLTDAINGMNAVDFQGAQAAWFKPPSGYLTGRTSVATFFVVKSNNDPPGTYYGAPVGGWGPGGEDYWPFGNGGIYTNYARSGRLDNINPSPDLSGWRVIMLYSAPNDWRLWIDGSEVFHTTSNTVSMGSTPRVGAADATGAFDGQVAKVADLNAAPTDAEIDKMFGALMWEFGLEANLPSGHPYEAGPPMT